jgi:hypothetical protein
VKNRLIASTVFAATLAFTTSANALFLFGPKKYQARCSVLTAHPGSGGIPKDLPARVLDAKGAGSLSTRVDVEKGPKRVTVSLYFSQNAQGQRLLRARFVDSANKVLKDGQTYLRESVWSSVRWEAWPRGMGYLEAQCLIERAK